MDLKSSISSVSYSLIIIENIARSFGPGKGLWQGNSLSSLPFHSLLECFTKLMDKEVGIQKVKVCQNVPAVSHILYAIKVCQNVPAIKVCQSGSIVRQFASSQIFM